MPKIARLGDTGTHGGKIVTAASRTRCEGAFVAREGDIYRCPIHGDNPSVGHSKRLMCEGRYVARHGDATECGATLVSGAEKSFDE